MRAIVSRHLGGPKTLELSDLADPEPGMGELRVRVLACGLNYPDLLMIEDKYQFRPPRPFAPGGEIAGVVEKVGQGVTDWRVGDRLIALIPHGGLAELAIVRADGAYPLPQNMDPGEGAALLCTYGTAIYGLVDRGDIQATDTLLVLGAAGGVGMAAVEIGKALNARVIAGVSSEHKAVAALDAGADETVIYDPGPLSSQAKFELAKSFKAAVGANGASIVFDPVGGDYAEPALRSIGWLGRYLVVGFPAGIPKLPFNLALLKGCDVRGVFLGEHISREPARHRRTMEQLLNWWINGKIRPRVDRSFPLCNAPEALEYLLSRRAVGKIVVAIAGEAG